MALPPVNVVYENPDWMPPLVEGLEAEGFEVRPFQLDGGLLDPAKEPAPGLWWNRVSPSSHTRQHHGTVPMARELLFWLELHGRRVINGSRALEIELSKLRQDLVLRRYGIATPRTVLATGTDSLLEGAATFSGPFITKHNQGGKGLGIHLFHDVDALRHHLEGPDFDPGPDGKIILQQYIEPADGTITRVEVVGDRFLFAMKSSTASGFELCPSDACQIQPDVCPADGGAPASKFSPSPLTADDPLVQAYLRLLAGEGLDLAGIEFVEDSEGRRYTYDINGTTNYSGVLGEQIGVHGMREVARYLRTRVVPALSER